MHLFTTMKIPTLLLGILSLVIGGSLSAVEKPNVLIMVADDLGSADVGFGGGKKIATPNLDRLALTGVVFTDFRACPMCSPTRAGMLTGRWPHRFGIMRAVLPPWSKHGLPPGEKTLPEFLGEAGYERRGIIGKWHLGHARRAFLPLAHGFTSFYGCYNGAIDYFTHERDGEIDWHRDDRTVREEGYATDLLAAEAVRFIQEAPEGKPWLLYVPFTTPHSPMQAKADDLAKYGDIARPNHRALAAMVDSLDQATGCVLAAVEGRKDADNTLVIFFSDNGGVPKTGSSNAPYRAGKLTVYEGGTRVCAALRWPAGGLVGGRKFDGRTGYIDILPTVLAAAGVPAPKNLDGVNLLPALSGKAELPERPWFSYIHQDADAHASVHLGSWKLVAHGDFFAERPATPPALELYDLSADPAEKNDVASDHASKVSALHKHLREFGTWQNPGALPYAQGRAGFRAPKDWVIQED
jgi:arylsulfatase B